MECPECKQTFSLRSNLSRHLKQMHPDAPPLPNLKKVYPDAPPEPSKKKQPAFYLPMEARGVLEDKHNVIDVRMAEFQINTCGDLDAQHIKKTLVRVHKSDPKKVDSMLKDLLPMLRTSSVIQI
jgi:hypothetical protein